MLHLTCDCRQNNTNRALIHIFSLLYIWQWRKSRVSVVRLLHHPASKLPRYHQKKQKTNQNNNTHNDKHVCLTEGAVSPALHLGHAHLHIRRSTYMWMLFLDFSSAFNSTHLQHLINKLTKSNRLKTSVCLVTGLLTFFVIFFLLKKTSVHIHCKLHVHCSLLPKCWLLSSVCQWCKRTVAFRWDDEVEMKQMVKWCDINNLVLNVNVTNNNRACWL